MKENYQYPIDFTWSKEEMITVIHFFNQVELAYEKGVNKEGFLKEYTAFKKVVPAIGLEKKMDKDFLQESGYSLYQAVKKAKETTQKRFKMEER